MIARSTAAPRSLALCLISLLLVTLAACPDDPYDPDTWIDKLDNPAEAGEALQRLQQLKDPKAIPALGKFWQSHQKASRVLRIIIDLAGRVDQEKGTGPTWAPAIPFLIEAIDDFDVGDQQSIDDAMFASEALGQAAMTGLKGSAAINTLVAAVNRRMPKLSPGQRVRIAALRALGKFGNQPAVVDTLLKALAGSVRDQPLKINAAAANALGAARNPKAIVPLIIAGFQYPALYQTQIRRALAAIGGPVVPHAIKVFKGTHKEVNAYAKEHNFATDCHIAQGVKTKCIAPGALQFKGANMLATLRVKKAVPMLLRALKQPANPSHFNPKTKMPGPSSHHGILDALKYLADASAADQLLAYWVNPKTPLAVRPIAIDTYSFIARNTKALPQLAKRIKDDSEEEAVRLSSTMAYARLVREKKQLGPLNFMIKRYKDAAKEEDKKAKKAKKAGNEGDAEFFEQMSQAYKGYQRSFQENKARAIVGIQCQKNPDCYVKFLDGDDVRMGGMGLPRASRGLVQLGKLGKRAKKVLPELLKRVDTSERFLREGILLAMPRIAERPCPECVARLREVVEKQKDMTTLDYLTTDTQVLLYYFEWAGAGTW